MKILVTGGAGFIGSNLCEKLVHQGHDVYSLDDYSSGSEENHKDGVTYFRGCTQDIYDIVSVIPDMIYHLGEYSRVEQSFNDDFAVLESNRIGTVKVLQFAKEYNCRIIYAGSSTKFSDNGYNSSPYAWSKASNVEMFNNYGEWYNLNYAVVYFYNVYGPNEINSGKMKTLIGSYSKLYKTEKLKVVLPGTQKRNFTHIDDTIRGLILVGEQGHGDGYGIGSDESYSVIEIARMFSENIEYIPERKGNRLSAQVENKRTKSLGWHCQHSLPEYIRSLKND